MKIAVIGAKGIPAKFGGIERYCQELYPQIVARGHQVDLYVQPSVPYQHWFSSFIYQKMKVIILPSFSAKRLSLLNSALNTICASFGNYDVIHIHGVAAAWFTWFARTFSNSTIILTCHQLEPISFNSHKTFRRLLLWLEKLAVSNVDEIVVTSQELTGYFWRKYGVRSQYIANAPVKYTRNFNNFNCRQAFGLDRHQYILYLGTFEPDRQLDLLIEAFQKLQPHNWKLVLAGDISNGVRDDIELLQMVQDRDNIIFTGEIGGNFLAELVRGAEVFVDPSDGRDLGSSVAMLEAMREGIPIVASDTLTHRQLLGRDRGLLFDLGQFDSLMLQLEYAMSKPNLLLAMAKKAQKYIAIHHNWDKVIYQNLFLYLQSTKVPLRHPVKPS